MTCVDANVYLRALTEPTTPSGRASQATAQRFFEQVHHGAETYTATVVAIHEVLYALTGTRPNAYGLSPVEACARMRPLLDLPGFRHADKQAILDAMKLWGEHPDLGFSDAFTAIVVRQTPCRLLTFDTDFDHFADLDRYRPAAYSPSRRAFEQDTPIPTLGDLALSRDPRLTQCCSARSCTNM